MAELSNCPKCNEIFVKNQFRDICQNCWKEEEKAYEAVYQFIRKRENRTAKTLEVVEATGVKEELILKFIKSGRLKLAHFPNLGYPCEKCGTSIREGKICGGCADELRKDLQRFTSEEEQRAEILKREKNATYFSVNEKINRRL
ncbi:membrane protein [Aeromicrobium ponti]|uniref:Flagellar operon protein (TIGR03826 family) n=1 Tax=Cytobacillus oceanisediminis TaxID=665099 RepID=A0A562K2T9_9BACI|nr:TIGR03826 family flagellar region protein [Cytobacillus oceanisediminis]TWH89738.1 flagellar operon protein (TIGR03826 family) [Cytobacillus oceanisediminis]